MKRSTITGFLQLILVVVFVFITFTVSRRMRLQYEPPTQVANGERSLFASTAVLEPGPYRIAFQTTGVVDVTAEVEIVPQVTGRITYVHPEMYSGGRFQANEVLFEVEPVDFALEVERAKAQVSQAGTLLQLELAEKEASLTEWRQINGEKEIPALVAREPQILEAEANVKAAEAQLASAELALARTRFRLPKNGRVLDSRISVGQFVVSGQSYGRVYYLDDLEVAASLQGDYLLWLYQRGQEGITLSADFKGQVQSYPGFLKREAASLDPSTRFATLQFGFRDVPEAWVPGVFCAVAIEGPEVSQILRIPIEALQNDGSLWMVNEDSRLERHEPDLLVVKKDHAAVRGFDGPVRLVLTPLPGASPGMKIITDEEEGDA